LAAAAFVLACAGATGIAFADRLSSASGKIRELLEQAAKDDDFPIVGDLKFGQIKEVDDQIFTFKVDPGRTYVAYGACDEHCTEFSLSAREKGGAFIDNSSGQDNDHPFIIIEDFKGDEITIEATMFECDDEPCAFGVALAESGEAEPPRTGRTVAQTFTLAELLTGGSSTSSSSGSANPDTTEPSDEELAELADRLKKSAPDGLVQVGDVGTGKRAVGEAMRYSFDIDPGKIYDVFAFCDSSCGNLDLVAYDDEDKELASDKANDARPIVEIIPDTWPASRRSGQQKLIIEVRMTSCSRAFCGYTVGVYGNK
jgi:hypothetical protein